MDFSTRIDGPVAVIGDIHGYDDKLISVLEKLHQTPDFQNRWIVFIGDFVDRGPNSRAVLDIITDLLIEHPRTTAISGNHELAMGAALGFLPVPPHADWNARWTRHYNSQPTFESYGVEPGALADLAAEIPDRHREFLTDLPWCVEHPHYLFVHAGLERETPLQYQMNVLRQRDFTMNRPPWLCSRSVAAETGPAELQKTVVSGHVRVPQVQVRKQRILLDTSGGEDDGELSCVLLPEKMVISSGCSAVASRGKSWWKIW